MTSADGSATLINDTGQDDQCKTTA
jgi:hypothetical protein